MDTLDIVNSKTRHAYNLVAQKYFDLFQNEIEQKAYDRNLLDRFAEGLDGNSLICDAGCGPCGHIGRYVFDKGIPVIGVDISDRCVQLAREHNPLMCFERADIGMMPFEDGAFDGIIAYYSVIDTPKSHVGGLFREFHRVLKSGGRLLVSVKEGTKEGYLTEVLGIKTEIYFAEYTLEELKTHFGQAKFEIEFIEQRSPYEFEISTERIFALGRKA